MDNDVFVNEGLDYALKTYMSDKNTSNKNSFFAACIRLLAIIYDELDLTGPYQSHNEKLLKQNLLKYGYDEYNLNLFFSMIDTYFNNPNEREFLAIQKQIIDMFAKKKLSFDISKEEIENFRKNLYSSEANSPLMVSYNYMMTSNPNLVLKYFDKQMQDNIRVVYHKEKEILATDAYKALNISDEEVEKMDAEQLDIINKQVYNHFEINNNAINKNYLLEEAIKKINAPKQSFSTGNGYVDILFVLSLITTILMVILLLTIFVF